MRSSPSARPTTPRSRSPSATPSSRSIDDPGRDRPEPPRTCWVQRVGGRRPAPRGRPADDPGGSLTTSDGRPTVSELPARDIVDVRLSAAMARGRLSDLRRPRALGAGDDGFDHRPARARHRVPRRARTLAGLLSPPRPRADPGRPARARRHARLVDPLRRDARASARAASAGRSARRAAGCGSGCGWPESGRRASPVRQGQTAVETALARSVERSRDPAWADALATAAFCLDDFLELWAVAGGDAAFRPVAERQVARMRDLRHRLDGFVDHSSHDRRHLLTDLERTATDEALGPPRRTGRATLVRPTLGRSRRRSGRTCQPVAEPVLGGDVGLAGSDRVELEPQVADRHPQQVDVDVVARLPTRRRGPADGSRAARRVRRGRPATGTRSG